MTITKPDDFKKLLPNIPDERFKNIWFFPVRQDRKNPDVPPGTILKGNTAYRLTAKDAYQRLKSGKNIGIYALPAGLMFLDIDVKDGKTKASKEFIKQIPETFTVKTRNGGYQYYYLNESKYSNQIIKEHGIEIGELRTNWYYVVGVGSFVTPDENNFDGNGIYHIEHNVSVTSFHGLENYITKGNIQETEIKTFSKKTEDKDEIRIEDYNKKISESGKQKRKLCAAELRYLQLEGL
jgi:hypothetical protein